MDITENSINYLILPMFGELGNSDFRATNYARFKVTNLCLEKDINEILRGDRDRAMVGDNKDQRMSGFGCHLNRSTQQA